MNVVPRTMALLLALAIAAGGAHAEGLLAVWQAAQARDAAYGAARRSLEMAGQKAMAEPTAQLRRAHEQFRLAGQELILSVSQVYFEVLVAQEGAGVALNQLKAMAQYLSLTQRNFSAGFATAAEVQEARSRFEGARAQRVAATTELEQRRAKLQKILGRPPESLSALDLNAALPALEPSEAQAWEGLAEQDNAQVRLRQAALDAASDELERQRAGQRPSLDVTAGRAGSAGGLRAPVDPALRNRSTQLGLQITVPLDDDGATQARLDGALAAEERRRAALLVARREAAAQARQVFAALARGRAQVQALAGAVAAAAAEVEAGRISYQTGRRVSADALNALQRLFAAQRDLFRARAETLMLHLRLKAAAGQLQEQEVLTLNALLMPPPSR